MSHINKKAKNINENLEVDYDKKSLRKFSREIHSSPYFPMNKFEYFILDTLE